MPSEQKNNTIKKDFFWNTVGSGIYALSSMLLAFAAMHIAGADDGGIFGFGFSTFGQQMFIIAYFGIRPFHITDSSYEYSFEDYRSLRRITVLTAVAASLLYLGFMSVIGSYSLHKSAIVLLLALYKIADGAADLYECECQRSGMLWLGGKELAIRTVLASAVLIAVMATSKNVLIACAAAVMTQFICIAVFKHYTEHHVFNANGNAAAAASEHQHRAETMEGCHAAADNIHEVTRKGKLIAIAGSTVLLFLSVFVDFYIFSAAKYAVDRYLTDAANGIFNILFMPTSVIYLVANFIIKPYMTRLSAIYETKHFGDFDAVLKRLLIAVAALSAAAVIGALLLGRPVLMILEYLLGSGYEGALSSKHMLFVCIILGGCFYAVTNLYYYILVIMRRQKLIFVIYCVVAVIAFILSSFAVRVYGVNGAALIYPCYMLIATVCFALCCRHLLNAAKRCQDK